MLDYIPEPGDIVVVSGADDPDREFTVVNNMLKLNVTRVLDDEGRRRTEWTSTLKKVR